MTQQLELLQKAITWPFDPVMRKQTKLKYAERKGIARMMDPLAKALADADADMIRFHGDRFVEYMKLIEATRPTFDALQVFKQLEPPKSLLLPQAQPDPNPIRTYIVSPATLLDGYKLLTQHQPGSSQEPEWMLAVTGVKQRNLRSMERLIDVKLAQQSAVRAGFDMQDFARIAITLHEQGLSLHSIWHSHRFSGPPIPSEVDWRLQQILDQGGYPAIQAVFSEDSYVRFFASRPFEITISGTGVECVDQETHLYRITIGSTLPQPRNVA